MLLVFWFAVLVTVAIAVVTLTVLPLCGALVGMAIGGRRGGGAMIAGIVLGGLGGFLLAIVLLVVGASCLMQ
jgi:hypothetical protein